MYRYDDVNIKRGIGEIKDIISDMALAHPSPSDTLSNPN